MTKKKVIVSILLLILISLFGVKFHKFWPTSGTISFTNNEPMTGQNAVIKQLPSLGKAPSITLIKVYKSKRYLELLHGDQVVRRYSIRLGFSPIGHKTTEGDGKTPEGKYILDRRNPNSSFYKSLHISYPNGRDQIQAKQRGVSAGGDVMIHGSAPKMGNQGQLLYQYMPYKDWTLGCVAVSNAAMDEIWQLVPDDVEIEIIA